MQMSVYVLQSPCFVRFEGRSSTSIISKPGTRPGNRRACSSAVFKINFTTCSTVSAEDVLATDSCSRALVDLNHFYDNVSLGCRNDFCGGTVEREMFSCRFFGRGSSIPFLYTVDFFFCSARSAGLVTVQRALDSSQYNQVKFRGREFTGISTVHEIINFERCATDLLICG